MKSLFLVKSIHIPLFGGLGNQLFQFSMGLYLTKYFDRVACWTDLIFKSHWTNKISSLVDCNSKTNFTRFDFIMVKFLSLLYPTLIIHENGSSDIPVFRIKKSSRLVVGYFQRYEYVDAVKSELLTALKKSEQFSALVPTASNDEIAVHIRRGDYAQESVKQVLGLTEMSYYAQGVRLLLKSTESYKKIVIYSDESQQALLEFVKEYGKSDIPIVASSFSNEYDDLGAMARSKGIVMSNSTFSWWAAWIGFNTVGSLVVAPRPWLATPSAADKNLVIDKWLVLDRVIKI